MPDPGDDATLDVAHLIGSGLPPGRLEALQTRLQALLTDFAHLRELETADLEPKPSFVVWHATGDRDE